MAATIASPKGGKPDKLIRDALIAAARQSPEKLKKIAEAMLDAAANGDVPAFNAVADRIDGKVPQTTINADFEKIKQSNDDELLSFITGGLTAITVTGSGGNGSTTPGPENTPAADTNAAGTAASVSGAVDTKQA